MQVMTERRVEIGQASGRDWDGARTCIAELFQWFHERTGQELSAVDPEARDEIVMLPMRYRPPHGVLFVGRDGARVVAVAALRFHDDWTAELKRVWTRPAARRQGVSRRLLAAATEEAERLGARRLWLHTSPDLMETACAMYRRFGFRPVDGRLGRSPSRPGVVRMERRLRHRET